METQGFWNRQRVIEYLILLFVACVIAAILLPVGPHNVPSPRRACISNMKQLTLATIMYASDSDDCLPPYYTFDGATSLHKFVDVTMVYTKKKDIYLCPGEKNQQEGTQSEMTYDHSLSLRGIIPSFSTGNRVLKNSDMKDPSQVVLLRDPIRGFGPEKSAASHFLSPHGQQFVVGYVDGHAKSRTPIDEFKEL